MFYLQTNVNINLDYICISRRGINNMLLHFFQISSKIKMRAGNTFVLFRMTNTDRR